MSSCTFHVLSAATWAVWYDMSLHIFGTRLSRDNPLTIIRRFCTVTVNCFLSIFLLWKLFQWVDPRYTLNQTLADVGLAINGDNLELVATSALVGVGCTCLLYLGEIFLLLLSGELKRLAEWEHWRSSILSLQCWRDIVVGPLSEEIVFRGCLVAALRHGCGDNVTFSIVVSSMLFGVAHLHHIVEMTIFQGYSVAYALQNVGFQIGYSSVFGLYASFLFVKTGHLAGPLLAHSLCNWLGIPRLVISERDEDEGTDAESCTGYMHRKLFQFAKRCLIFIYVLGLVLFIVLLSYLPQP